MGKVTNAQYISMRSSTTLKSAWRCFTHTYDCRWMPLWRDQTQLLQVPVYILVGTMAHFLPLLTPSAATAFSCPWYVWLCMPAQWNAVADPGFEWEPGAVTRIRGEHDKWCDREALVSLGSPEACSPPPKFLKIEMLWYAFSALLGVL